jgi:acyl phosphate:glycerol-3-phosphate acyltransferase
MDWSVGILAAVIGYVLGSISFARVINRLVAPSVDVARTEVPMVGTDDTLRMPISGTAVSVQLGPKWGMFTALLDMLKVAVPTLILRLAYPNAHYFLIVATLGVVGHIWPLFHRFKGGRGLSPIYGGLFVVDFLGVWVTSFGGLFLGLVVVRDVVVSFMAGIWLMIPWLWFRTYDVWYLAYGVAVNILFVVAMIPEIRQVIEARKKAGGANLTQDMDAVPMTRMIAKMANRLGLLKKT